VTRRSFYKGIFVFVIIVCTVLFAREVDTSGFKFDNIDKVAHFGIFFILTACLRRAIKAPVWVYVLILAAYGGGVELMQAQIPHRQASWADFFADVAGVIAYLVFHQVAFGLKKFKANTEETSVG
jgi:VanZ family protein